MRKTTWFYYMTNIFVWTSNIYIHVLSFFFLFVAFVETMIHVEIFDTKNKLPVFYPYWFDLYKSFSLYVGQWLKQGRAYHEC